MIFLINNLFSHCDFCLSVNFSHPETGAVQNMGSSGSLQFVFVLTLTALGLWRPRAAFCSQHLCIALSERSLPPFGCGPPGHGPQLLRLQRRGGKSRGHPPAARAWQQAPGGAGGTWLTGGPASGWQSAASLVT